MSMGNDLHHESVYDALRTAVLACGGWKKVATTLRPEWDEKPDQAARWLQDCLNESRSEKLSIDQMMRVMRMARRVGCHAVMNQIASEAGYSDPAPIEPEDELTQCYRQFSDGVGRLTALIQRVEHLKADMRGEPRSDES